MEGRASQLSAALFGATSFDEAARLTLRSLLDLASARLAASSWAGAGRILRGIVHLRPAPGYRRLVVVDALPGEDSRAEEIIPSASAWRWVAEHHCPVALDTNLGTVTLAEGGRFTGAPTAETARDPMTSESRARLIARKVSHILLVPLRAPGGAIDGMVSIEADCLAATGQPFVWPELIASAQILTDLAAPFLATLPTERHAPIPTDTYLPVIGASMAGLVEMLRIFAQQEETLLLSGPTGAGKSRLALWCHHHSWRKDGPFEILDLATFPEELQLANLFGWKRGAFTGATRDTAGAVTRAAGGTLFIDEIDKLSLRAQAGLLRVFEERRYRPLGEGAQDHAADVRFIVGTNANVRELVKTGRFREDLYYRVNVLPVQVPPLSERRDEIPDWARFMLRRRHGQGAEPAGRVDIAPDAVERMVSHPWPGNLRQLDNIVRRAYALTLLESSGESRDVTLRAAHLARALSLEDSRSQESEGREQLLQLLVAAAEAFVAEAQRIEAAGGVLKLEHLDALRGLVLAAAARRLQSKEEAFRLFGREAAVSNRNLGKVLKAELARIEALCEALGQPLDPALVAGIAAGDA